MLKPDRDLKVSYMYWWPYLRLFWTSGILAMLGLYSLNRSSLILVRSNSAIDGSGFTNYSSESVYLGAKGSARSLPIPIFDGKVFIVLLINWSKVSETGILG
jgi:hypothetical protein